MANHGHKKTTKSKMKNIELPSAETIRAAQVEPLFYDINQAAQALNVSTKSVRRLLRVRKLTSCKALRKVLIPRNQIEEFIKASCDAPAMTLHPR